MSSRVTLNCPHCDETIIFRFVDEYQGEAPMGGYVSLLDDMEQNCDCKLTDEEVEELTDEACAADPDDDDLD